jgi:hypothetical protein
VSKLRDAAAGQRTKGTNSDGSINDKYCVHCYKNGAFTWKNATAEQMRIYCTGILMQRHWPGFAAKMATRSIPKLERWRA